MFDPLKKVLSLEELTPIREHFRAKGKTVVLTNGHFDVLHVGHVDCLQRAKALGDVLVVGLNSDASTRLLKGQKRPIVPQEERAQLLAAGDQLVYRTKGRAMLLSLEENPRSKRTWVEYRLYPS